MGKVTQSYPFSTRNLDRLSLYFVRQEYMIDADFMLEITSMFLMRRISVSYPFDNVTIFITLVTIIILDCIIFL